jgi:hypothetical protein
MLSPDEIEHRIMALVRKGGGRRSIEDTIVYVGSFGTEPNWFARPVPPRPSSKSMKRFVSALAHVRQQYDLLVNPAPGTKVDFLSAWSYSSRSRPRLGLTGHSQDASYSLAPSLIVSRRPVSAE